MLKKASAYVSEWWHNNIYLDPSDRYKPGYGATQLLLKPQRYEAPTEEKALREWVQATADAITNPIVVVMEDLQWLDDMSADIIYHVIRQLGEVPMFNLVTMRSNRRDTLTRFPRLARTESEAIHIVLQPLTVSEVRHSLISLSGLPIGDAVAAAVHDHTDGFPMFVEHIGRWLGSTEAGRGRRICDSFQSLEDQGGPAEYLANVAQEMLKEFDETVGEVLRLLACAYHPLSVSQICQALGWDSFDLEAVRDTCLVRWSATSGKLSIQYGVMARALGAALTVEQWAAYHRQLGKVEEGSASLLHKAELARLSPQGIDVESLAEELIAAGMQAVEAASASKALDLTRAACEISPSQRTVEAYARSALRGRSSRELKRITHVVRDLPLGALRSGILARVSLDSGNLDEVFYELARAGDLSEASLDSLLIYADAVAAAGRIAAGRGRTWGSAQIIPEVLSALDAAEQLFSQDTGAFTSTACTADRLHTDLINIRAVVRMWGMLSAAGEGAASTGGGLSRLLTELDSVPGTEYAKDMIRAVRGGRYRQFARRPEAYADLSQVAHDRYRLDDGISTYTHIQLALLLFDAGLWDEASVTAHRAAAEVLNDTEDDIAILAYGVSALVPKARGKGDPYERQLDVVAAVPEDLGMLGQSARHQAEAWGALARGNHEAALGHLLKMHGAARWVRGGATSALLLGRSYYYTGRQAALGSLIAEIESNPTPTTRL